MYHDGQPDRAVELLVNASERLSCSYKPAALRLAGVAAELERTVDPQSAHARAELCARAAASGGMYSLMSRAASVIVATRIA